MKFGTLQSISKETDDTKAPFGRMDDESAVTGPEEDTFGDDAVGDELDGMDDEFNFGDEQAEEEEGNPVITKLLSLKAEIDDILSDMGYADDSFDDFDFDSEGENGDEFNFDDAPEGENGDEFNFDDAPAPEEGSGEEDFFDNQQLTGDEPVGQESPDTEAELDFDDETPEEDENFQGNVRTVAGADLVYKRKDEDGNYEELWIYNVGSDIRQETRVRRAILAGTDIVPSQRESEDGTQQAETTTLGNVQYLKITGLPN